ncbi:MAG: archaemetzincin family Zn-dependent metalloprotease [Syntrophaceae bacterium]|nr:archaemetzincin family Zn-dependent metalloprotease [Syntrophaceae bacterium]
MGNILIVPIGEIAQDVLDHIASSVRRKFKCKVATNVSISVPQNAYNAMREQYRTIKLLSALASLKPDMHTTLLGMIDQDIYVPKLNFVFGCADPLLDIAIIALPRLRQEFYDLTPEEDLFLLRAEKEAIHELGHIRGLAHCMNPKCIMYFSNSLRDTDEKKTQFCAACRKYLREQMQGESYNNINRTVSAALLQILFFPN